MPDLDRRGRLVVLAICCCSLFVVGMDVTIVNLALPAIGRDLDAGFSGLQWTIDAYTLVLASLLVPAGSTADRVGRRKVFRIGLVLLGSVTFGIIESPTHGLVSP
ncbi:MFS transporter [Pseudonocardia sediminis]|uniref:MFS transporter n=1 Tax=Pseudonocardia sediminis TaxID=1397368 RepID=UPI001028A7CF|nr:MFS transporter [Pseudonocardia sediminis]